MDSDLAKSLLQALRIAPIELACDATRVSLSAYHDWIKRGETGEEPYATFRVEALAARANYAVNRLTQIHKASESDCDGDWKAAAWYLERCWPQHFSPYNRTDLAVTDRTTPPLVQLLREIAGRPVEDNNEAR
jgi:hypothetical protein